MMMKKIICVALLTGLIIITSCGLNKPTELEGKGTLHVQVVDDTQTPTAAARVQWINNNGIQGPVSFADSMGLVTFTDLSSAEYTVAASLKFDEAIEYFGSEVVGVASGKESSVTVPMQLNTAGLKINEIYTAGPVNNEFYFYDLFIELYNGGADTVYLDGTILIRGGSYNLAGKDNDQDGDIDYDYFDTTDGKLHHCFIYAFQLTGDPFEGREYPVAPGQYVVVAGDAVDHRKNIATSIDLSNADYEFYNPYYFRDPCNPNAPDYVNIITGEYGDETTVDFLAGLTGDIILLASGEDSEYWDGIDIDTIIDGVEYSSKKDHIHHLDERIDKGHAGVLPDKKFEKYNGMSLQRIRPGFDTNNSTVDFTILDSPTPGY